MLRIDGNETEMLLNVSSLSSVARCQLVPKIMEIIPKISIHLETSHKFAYMRESLEKSVPDRK